MKDKKPIIIELSIKMIKELVKAKMLVNSLKLENGSSVVYIIKGQKDFINADIE